MSISEKKKKLPRQVQAVDESDIDDINGVKVHDSSQQALDKLLTRSHDLLNKMGIAQDENGKEFKSVTFVVC